MYKIKRLAGVESTAIGYDLLVLYKGECGHKKITRRDIVKSGISLGAIYQLGVGNCVLNRMPEKAVNWKAYRKIFGLKENG
jgi:hypothetical protein